MGDRKPWTGIQWLCHGPTALSRVTNPNPGLEYEKNMVYEDFLNMGILPLEIYIYIYNIYIYNIYIYIQYIYIYTIYIYIHMKHPTKQRYDSQVFKIDPNNSQSLSPPTSSTGPWLRVPEA